MHQQPNPLITTTSGETSYFINVQQIKNSFQTSSGAGNRLNHTIAYYDEQIFIFGGTSASNVKQDEHYKTVYWYSLQTKQWGKKEFVDDKDKQKDKADRDKEKQKQREREKEKARQMSAEGEQRQQREQQLPTNIITRSYMASCQKSHKIYLFGGTNAQNQPNNNLLVFNMSQYLWEAPQNHNPPQQRQSAHLTAYTDNYLLLYGGIDVQKCQIYEYFHSYHIPTGFWRIVDQGGYQSVLRPRYLPGICSAGQTGNKIYVFGGQYRNADGYHSFLADFYELTVSTVKKNGRQDIIQGKGKSSINQQQIRIECRLLRNPTAQGLCGQQNEGHKQNSIKNYPQAKSAHKLLCINDQYLVLIGGANSQHSYLSNVWMYSITNQIWKKIQFDFTIPKQAGIDSCITDYRKNLDKRREVMKQVKQSKDSSIKESGKADSIKQSVRDDMSNREVSKEVLYSVTRRDTRRQAQKQKQRQKEQEKGDQKQKQKSKDKERQKDKEKEKEREHPKKSTKQLELKFSSKYGAIYIYGGLNCYDSLRCDLFRLQFESNNEDKDSQEIQNAENIMKAQQQERISTHKSKVKSLQQFFHVEPIKSCLYCEFPKNKIIISRQMIESFTNMVPYPFNAIGLFLQNTYNNNATDIYVAYRNQISLNDQSQTSNKMQDEACKPQQQQRNELFRRRNQYEGFITKTQPFLHIIENNKLNYSYSQIRSAMKNFQYILYFTYHNIEKKVRLALQKEHQLHEFGTYLKIGALRLGNQFVYLMRGSVGQFWVFSMLLDKSQQNSYEFCSYVWDIATKKIVEPTVDHETMKIKDEKDEVQETKQFSEYSYLRINQKYEKYLQDIFHSLTYDDKSNHLLIFDLRTTSSKSGENIAELIPYTETIDICYSPYRKLLSSHAPGIYESIDLSMRAYMSSYFLRSQFPKMFIKINNLLKPISSQICLQSFDLMAKNKSIYEIDNSIINIQVKLMELYFNPVLTSSMISFHNGILFYHKGRLVARHQCPIGELYKKVNNKNYNFFHFFGLLQVPEPILPNIFRTEFIYNVMMEKLRSRLKFMQKKLVLEFENSMNLSMLQNLSPSAVSSINQQRNMKISKKQSTTQVKDKQKERGKQRDQKQKQRKQDMQFNPADK